MSQAEECISSHYLFRTYACSQVLIAYTFHESIVDLGTIKLVTRDRGGLEDYH